MFNNKSFALNNGLRREQILQVVRRPWKAEMRCLVRVSRRLRTALCLLLEKLRVVQYVNESPSLGNSETSLLCAQGRELSQINPVWFMKGERLRKHVLMNRIYLGIRRSKL